MVLRISLFPFLGGSTLFGATLWWGHACHVQYTVLLLFYNACRHSIEEKRGRLRELDLVVDAVGSGLFYCLTISHSHRKILRIDPNT
jgi:hypothetical protein